MKAAAKILNIKSHFVWDRAHTKRTLIHSPVDVEGHLGYDNRYYVCVLLIESFTLTPFLKVIDCSRLFPPVSSFHGVKSSHLYCLMRPEFVRQ